MPLQITCPACAIKISATDAASGKRVKCPKCSARLSVPERPRGPVPATGIEKSRASDEASDTPVRDRAERASAKAGEPTAQTGKKNSRSVPILAVAGSALLIAVVVGIIVIGLAMGTPETTGGSAPVDSPPKRPQEHPGPRADELALPKPLIEIPLPELEPISDHTPDRFVYFESPPAFTLEQLPRGTPLLSLEIFRQAALMAARDELGLITRDQSLGETYPEKSAPRNQFRVTGELLPHDQRSLEIEQGRDAERTVIWKAASAGRTFEGEVPLESVKHAEAFSRLGFATAFKKRGLGGRANRIDPGAEVSAEAKKWMREPIFESQYAAVRDIHRTIREKGESPQTLGELSRAYAHLGLLTELQWDA